MYADDSKLKFSLVHETESDLKHFVIWRSHIEMHFDFQKTQYLVIGSKGSEEGKFLKFSSVSIPASELVTDFALMIKESLKWVCNMKTNLQKSYWSFLSLKRNLTIIPVKSTKIKIYRSFFVPALFQASKFGCPAKRNWKKYFCSRNELPIVFQASQATLTDSENLSCCPSVCISNMKIVYYWTKWWLFFNIEDIMEIQQPITYPLRRPEEQQFKIPKQRENLSDADFFVPAARAGNYIQQKTNLDGFEYLLSFKRALKNVLIFFYCS